MNVRVPRRGIAAALVIISFAAGVTASCTKDNPGTTSAPPSASPTPSVDRSVADAEQQARAAYTGYIQAWAIASQAGDPDSPDLARYVADPLLGRTRHAIRVIRDRGAIQIGAQKGVVTSAKVDLGAQPPTVTLNTCLDYTELKLVYRSSRSPVPGSEITKPKVSAVVTVARYATGQWLVNETKEGTDTC